MTGDFQEEISIASVVDESILWRAAKGDATKNEGPGMVSEFLLPVVSLFSNKGDRLKMAEPELRNAKGRKHGLYW